MSLHNRIPDYDKRFGKTQNRGSEYVPLLHIQDFASKGIRGRYWGKKCGRMHELFSKLEYRAFKEFEKDPKVVDIRESFPCLPVSKTVEIAKRLGVKHPVIPNTHRWAPRTFDFLLTIDTGDELRDVPVTVKQDKDLKRKRVREKLDIEQNFSREVFHVDLLLYTEKGKIVRYVDYVKEFDEDGLLAA